MSEIHLHFPTLLGLGFRASGSGFTVHVEGNHTHPNLEQLKCGVSGFGFGGSGDARVGFGVWGLGFGVWGLGFRVQGAGCRV